MENIIGNIILISLIPAIIIIYMALYEMVLDMRANRKIREWDTQEEYLREKK